jgi:very-short-patch-repair endonuclease
MAVGLTLNQIYHRVRSGLWVALRPGVYAVAGMPPTWEQAVCAVALCCGDVVASHWTAARLLGCRVPNDVERIEITSPYARCVRLPGVVGHRSFHLFDPDRTSRSSIACTSAARLIVDLSGRLDGRALGRLSDDLQRRKLLTLGAVSRCIQRLPQAPGRSPKTVHEMLARRWQGYVPGDSDFETRVLRLIAAAGLPLPRQQYRVVLQGKRRYIDICYPEIMLAIEVQGPHHDMAWQEDYDAIRGNELVLLGWRVIEITPGMTDDEIVDQIRRALDLV